MDQHEEQHVHHTEGMTGRVTGIENKLAVMDYRLGSNEALLKEISDAVKQLVVLTQEQKALREDIHDLRKDFEERKKITDPVIMNAEKTIGLFIGAGLVMGILLTVVGWVAVDNIQTIKNVAKEVGVLQTQVEVLKNK